MIKLTDVSVVEQTLQHDKANLNCIQNALNAQVIDADSATYLHGLYCDSMNKFRDVFHVLGKCLGAPKTAVYIYDYEQDSAINDSIQISDINPLNAYIVNHRLDADPMRNQFFSSGIAHKIDLSVSSIVTVIVAAEKKVERAIEKITNKYYPNYVNQVLTKTHDLIMNYCDDINFANSITNKMSAVMHDSFVTNIAEQILKILGPGYESLAVNMVRNLDKITKPYEKLRDVWRIKCLFDLIPQARTFIEHVQEVIPEQIISIRDNFYDMDNPRNYRDAKLVINLGKNGQVVPLEVICQVRTFFEFERKTHSGYENLRSGSSKSSMFLDRELANYMEDGVKEYNKRIYDCLEILFERIGWNILYAQDSDITMFEGFPKKCKLYYSPLMVDRIIEKLEMAVENGVFHITNSPSKLTKSQESQIFNYMAKFVLIAAMPYMQKNWEIENKTTAGKLFNFVLREVQRYCNKS